MTRDRRSGPPGIARRMLTLVLPPSVSGRSTAGDLIEEFHRRPPGLRRRLWFWSASAELIARYLPGRLAATAGSVRQDIGYTLRLARRYPALSLTAIASLGLAIGVATAAFTFINGTWLRRHLSIDDEVVRIWRTHANGASAVWPVQEFAALRQHATVQKIEGWTSATHDISSDAPNRGTPGPVLFVTGSYLSTFDAGPARGRLLTEADDRRGAAPVAVLDHLFWRRHFGGDPDIVGRTISIGNARVTVVGIADRDFIDPSDRQPALWVPLSAFERLTAQGTASTPAPAQLYMVARVRPELRSQAGDELSRLLSAVPPAASRPATGGGFGSLISDDEIAATTRVLIGVFSVVVLVLVLAAANVSNLQLAGVAARQREIAVRCVCGASRRRVIRQLMTESLLLGCVAGIVGFIAAQWLSMSIAATLGWTTADLDPDYRVYLFVVAVTAIAAFGISLAPALYTSRRDVSSNLAGSTSHGGRAAGPGRTRSIFIGIQAAASIVIVAIAALLVRALIHIAWLNPGFDVDRLLTVSTQWFSNSEKDAARARDFWPAAIDRIRALPGIERTSLSLVAPFETTFGEPDAVQALPADADFFSTLGLRLIAGRTYDAAEVAANAPVAVISETAARRFWPGASPIGQPVADILGSRPPHTVIGVVADAMTFRVHGRHTPFVFVPLATRGLGQLTIRARDPRIVAGLVQESLRALSPDAKPVVTLTSDRFASNATRETTRARRYALLGAGVAAFALVLSIVGLAGVTSFAVRTRMREMAIRTSLGATTRGVVTLFLRDGLRAVVIGLTVGIVGALLAGRLLTAMLYGVSARDPLAMTSAVVVLLFAASLAVYIPARRALRLEPARVLRDS